MHSDDSDIRSQFFLISLSSCCSSIKACIFLQLIWHLFLALLLYNLLIYSVTLMCFYCAAISVSLLKGLCCESSLILATNKCYFYEECVIQLAQVSWQ